MVLVPLRPDDDHQASVEKPGGDVSRLAVIEALVDHGRRQSREHLAGAGEIQAAMAERQIALARVEGDRWQLSYPQ